MSAKKSLIFSERIAAPLAQVFRAFTSSAALQSWFADFAEIDARKGGRFYAWWNTGFHASGTITKHKENRRIALTWFGAGEPKATKLKIAFTEEDGETVVEIKHKGLGDDDRWQQTTQQIQTGWETALANLKSVMETGLDKRVFDQPMLWVFPSG